MRLIKIIIPCLLLGACVFGTSKTSKFYTQSATVADVIAPDYTAFIGINRVQLPKYLERPQMVTQVKNSQQISISEYNRWVEYPSVLATRVLTKNLSALLPAAQVKPNQFKGEKFDKTVSVEIMELTAILGEQAQLQAWYTIKNKTGKNTIYQKFETVIAIGNTYDDLAQGYNQLLAALSQEIAAALSKK